MADAEEGSVLFAPEAESYVEALCCFSLKEIGSSRWLSQHEQLEKLNMQAALSAKRQEDEFVKEFLISHDKIPVLVYDLVAIEVWKSRVFPLLLKSKIEPTQTFPCYIALYHEATLINLLETVLYHDDAVQAGDDVMLDLAEYCCSRIVDLVARHNDGESFYVEDMPKESTTGLEELRKQYRQIWFQVTVKSVSILRYLITNISHLPVSIGTRLLKTHDIICCFVELVDNPPWTYYTKDSKVVKYTEARWSPVDRREMMAVTKTEAQVWLALHHALTDIDCQRKCSYSDHRKAIVLKLRGKLNDVLIDQIPFLSHLQRYLENLAVMDVAPPKEELIIEQIPEIREKLVRDNRGKWKEIAELHKKVLLQTDPNHMRMMAERFSETYSLNVFEELACDSPKCALCGELATKRCSRCRNEWYCKRECQVKHWSKHKVACTVVAEAK